MSTWRYEAATKTIRSVPENYWIASMDSWDKAVDHEKNATLIAAAPELLEACKEALDCIQHHQLIADPACFKLSAAIAKAEAHHG